MNIRQRVERLEKIRRQKKLARLQEKHTCGSILMFENWSGNEGQPPIPPCAKCKRERTVRFMEFCSCKAREAVNLESR